jgi:hypothetical protein
MLRQLFEIVARSAQRPPEFVILMSGCKGLPGINLRWHKRPDAAEMPLALHSLRK